MTTFNSTQFSYNKQTKVFSAFMSDLDQGGRIEPFKRIFDDAPDIGFSITSSISGKAVDYVVLEFPTDEKNRWVLAPTAHAIRRVPQAIGTKVVVYNT